MSAINRFHLDLVRWDEVKYAAEMVEKRTMQAATLQYGPLIIHIGVNNPSQLIITFRDENETRNS